MFRVRVLLFILFTIFLIALIVKEYFLDVSKNLVLIKFKFQKYVLEVKCNYANI